MKIGICSWNRDHVIRFIENDANESQAFFHSKQIALDNIRVVLNKQGEVFEYIWIRPHDTRGRIFDKVYIDVGCSVKEAEMINNLFTTDYFGWEY